MLAKVFLLAAAVATAMGLTLLVSGVTKFGVFLLLLAFLALNWSIRLKRDSNYQE